MKIPFAAKMNFNAFQVRRYKRANRKVSVVLQERTKHLGKKSEVVSVKPGRARNHLIPQKLAKYATEENVDADHLSRGRVDDFLRTVYERGVWACEREVASQPGRLRQTLAEVA